MKTYNYTVKVHKADPDETGFWVEVPALPGCVTQGETYEEALGMAHEAIQLYLEGLIEEGLPIPQERAEQHAEKVIVAVNLPSAAMSRVIAS
ncbi:MAG TPA: type II toxin-antitoxin system HicB family antitoxin [Tepidisphaeraceae bacterium]|jgi:predicted RNase H-like HicB family nuclease